METTVTRPIERMIIFIDAQNLKFGERAYRATRAEPAFRIGYRELLHYFRSDYNIIRAYFYDGAPHHSCYTPERARFYEDLRKLGITLRLKELGGDPQRWSQKGVDIYLTTDMISLAYENAYDIALILSGDGDYEALIELVKSKGRKVWIASFKSGLSTKLKRSADKVILLDSIPEHIRRGQQRDRS